MTAVKGLSSSVALVTVEGQVAAADAHGVCLAPDPTHDLAADAVVLVVTVHGQDLDHEDRDVVVSVVFVPRIQSGAGESDEGEGARELVVEKIGGAVAMCCLTEGVFQKEAHQ